MPGGRRVVVVACRECGAERVVELSKYTGLPSLKTIALKLKGLRCPGCGREYGEPELAGVAYHSGDRPRGRGGEEGGREGGDLAVVAFKTPSWLHDRLHRAAAEEGASVSDLVREAAELVVSDGGSLLGKATPPAGDEKAVSAKIPRALKEKLDRAARELGLTRSEALRLALTAILAKRGFKNAG
jgi:predicted DNA-binding protein